MLYGKCTFQPLYLCSYGEVVGEVEEEVGGQSAMQV